jgi:uncharacterized protein (DUF488 family)
MKNIKPQIKTIGHSNKPITDFLDLLEKHQIEVLVDVRTIPRSRFSPHFNEKPLGSSLAKRSIKYLNRGQNLGGRGVNVGYEEAIEELVELARQGVRVCVMCSEADYTKCHRYSTITPSLHRHDVEVFHIEYAKTVNGRKKLTRQTPQNLRKPKKPNPKQSKLL